MKPEKFDYHIKSSIVYSMIFNQQTHSEIRSSWNGLSSPLGMKTIDEKLIDIDLVVDIKSKSDFRPENHDLEGKCLKVSVPIKSHPHQYIK